MCIQIHCKGVISYCHKNENMRCHPEKYQFTECTYVDIYRRGGKNRERDPVHKILFYILDEPKIKVHIAKSKLALLILQDTKISLQSESKYDSQKFTTRKLPSIKVKSTIINAVKLVLVLKPMGIFS